MENTIKYNYKYTNHNNKPIYVLHFPGSAINTIGKYHTNVNKDRIFEVSKDITIISIISKDYAGTTTLEHQLNTNNIKMLNSAKNETEWDNTKKIKYILESLEQVKTEYVLILDGRDTIIVDNLTDDFLNEYKAFNKDIVFNSGTQPFPKIAVEPLSEIKSIPGYSKYLNAGICIGKKDSLIKFYNECEKIRLTLPDNKSEQLIVRMARQNNLDIVGVDYQCDLFRVCHLYDTTYVGRDSDLVNNIITTHFNINYF